MSYMQPVGGDNVAKNRCQGMYPKAAAHVGGWSRCRSKAKQNGFCDECRKLINAGKMVMPKGAGA